MATVNLDFSNVEQPKVFTPSAQQVAIFDWVENGQGNGLIIAVAGAGKTTTLIQAVSRMKGSVVFCAYNRKIADEIQDKVSMLGLHNVRVGTFHSFGFRAWRRIHPGVQVNGNKVRELMDDMNVRQEWQDFVGKLVSMVRQHGPEMVDADWSGIIDHYGLAELLVKPGGTFGSLGGSVQGRREFDAEDDGETLEAATKIARRVLQRSIDIADEVIDFDDQIFMPLYAGAGLEVYDWVLVDEAQDSNPTRRLMAKGMLKSNGRLLAVGDPAQAIYGFTGADSESLANIRAEFGCADMSLTVSYRCPRAVVRVAQQYVSHIQPADDAPEGTVLSMTLEDMLVRIQEFSRAQLEESSVLCRKNAPLVGLAFSLIRSHIPCHVEGRDIGAQIKSLAKKWVTNDLGQLVVKVEEFKAREMRKYIAKKQETQAEAIGDKCDTLVALIDGLQSRNPGATKRDLFDWCDKFFGDTANGQKNGLTLSSIHKSKGREWKTVYWLGAAAYQPSKFAVQEWQVEQEVNLMYVAATRAQDTLVHVSVPAK